MKFQHGKLVAVLGRVWVLGVYLRNRVAKSSWSWFGKG